MGTTAATDSLMAQAVRVTTGWTDLVTTALLGTERRPVPDELVAGPAVGTAAVDRPDPATLVLELAAQHRAVTQAGRPLDRCAAVVAPPAESSPPAPAPAAAHELLASLLHQPEPGLVNAWLAACSGRGWGVMADLWPRLAALAARNAGYDRPLLLRVLGARGRWVLEQNPAWARLAAVEEDEAAPPRLAEPAEAVAAVHRGDPERALRLVLDCPDPWPPALCRAALELVASGALRTQQRAAAQQIGARLPLERLGDLAPLDTVNGEPGVGPPTGPAALAARRVAQRGLELVELAVRTRTEIERVFTEPVPEGNGQQPTRGAQP